MLQITHLTKRFGATTLFNKTSFFLNVGDRVALLGPNGSGKTTFFRIILGKERPDSGEISLRKGVRIGFLAQEDVTTIHRTVISETLAFSPEIVLLQKKIMKTAETMATSSGKKNEELLKEYGALHTAFENLGGYSIEHRAKIALAGLGFKEKDFFRPIEEFSGGWKMRIALAKLLVHPPDLLILDEPTNHLDLHAVLWLESYLVGAKKTLLFTSHDREFIDHVATRIIDIDQKKLVGYKPPWELFQQEKNKMRQTIEAAKKNQEKKIAEAQRFIERFRATATKARSVQSRIKMVKKMETIELPQKLHTMTLKLPQPIRSGLQVITLSDLYKSYGETSVYQGIDFSVTRGEKIAFLGANGAGKSTLLKILAGVVPVDSGRRIVGHNVHIGYYPQNRIELLHPKKSSFEEIAEVYPDGKESKIRGLLGRFLFSGDDADKPVHVLSGGEKSRLVMAKILANPPNCILLDEPVNHLDIPSRDILINALKEFEGTLCFISHDLHFIKKVATKIVEINNGILTQYPGNYDYYIQKKKNQEVLKEEKKKEQKPSTILKKKKNLKKESTSSQITLIEEEFRSLLEKIDSINQSLADPKTYQKPGFEDLAREEKHLRRKSDLLFEKWECLIEESEKKEKEE
ncbi:MAG: ABC-F family ATP-binding cassette domain-containing protein [Candidatus Ratteibacteria bacterium]|jgi:ATP-binding cassette subfamily F protein 3